MAYELNMSGGKSMMEHRLELLGRDYIALLTALPKEVRQSAPASTAETMRVMVLK